MTLRHRLLPDKRIGQLKRLLAEKKGLRIIEAHNGLSGIIGTTASAYDEASGETREFDGLWISSLTDSAAKAHPDIAVIDTSSRLLTIQEILQVTDKPIIVDGDTGGQPTQFEYFCSKLEALGVSAIIIEDKKFPKRNSLDGDAIQILEDPHVFATKVNRAKSVCLSDDFMIFTRIESFIAGLGLEDALKRAAIYLDSQADGIFIHSNIKTTAQIDAFMAEYPKLCAKKGIYKPVVCVPTTYNAVTDVELFEKGFQIVIYANHQLRAAHRAMETVCDSILVHQRSFESNEAIAPVKDIMEAVGFFDVKAKDKVYKKKTLPVFVLAAGKPKGFVDTVYESHPISDAKILGESLLTWQRRALKQAGYTDMVLVTGHGADQLEKTAAEVAVIKHNPDFLHTNVLYSLMQCQSEMAEGFIMVFGDIFFDARLLSQCFADVDADIVLLVDNAFNLKTRQTIKPTTDLVVLEDSHLALRKPNVLTQKIARIGNHIPVSEATHEFIGIAKFSAEGARQLCRAYAALSSEQAVSYDFYAIIEQLIHEGVTVDAMEVNQGWSEVHNLTDIAAIEKVMHRNQNKQSEAMSI